MQRPELRIVHDAVGLEASTEVILIVPIISFRLPTGVHSMVSDTQGQLVGVSNVRTTITIGKYDMSGNVFSSPRL